MASWTELAGVGAVTSVSVSGFQLKSVALGLHVMVLFLQRPRLWTRQIEGYATNCSAAAGQKQRNVFPDQRHKGQR